MSLLKKYVINSDNIEVKEINRAINEFRDCIKQSIQAGERTYLPIGNLKEPEGYKDPTTISQMRAAFAWNILNPDNQIEFPSKASLLKLNIMKESDIDDLKLTHPDIYDKIMRFIFNDETGYFVKREWDPGMTFVRATKKNWIDDIPKKYRLKYKKEGPEAWNKFVSSISEDSDKFYSGGWILDKKGLQVLAIPSNSEIPEWVKPYIDYDTMINTILAPFTPVLEIFKSRTISTGKSQRKSEGFSNIVKF